MVKRSQIKLEGVYELGCSVQVALPNGDWTVAYTGTRVVITGTQGSAFLCKPESLEGSDLPKVFMVRKEQLNLIQEVSSDE